MGDESHESEQGTEAPERRTDRRSGVLMLLYALVVTIVVCGLYESELLTTFARADLVFSLPALHLVGVVIVLRRRGRPRDAADIMYFLMGNVLLVLLQLMFRERSNLWWLRYSIAILVRAAICAGWTLSALTVVLVLVSVRHGTFRWHRNALKWLRVCLAATLLTGSLEVTSLVLTPEPAAAPKLPQLAQTEESDERLVAAIGGSTMAGFPYAPKFGIAQVAVWRLRELYPDYEIRLKNVAMNGANLSIAMGQLSELDRCPDVLLVYSGHNQFFHNVDEMMVSRRTDFGWIDRLLKPSPTFRLVKPIVSQYLIGVLASEDPMDVFSQPLCTPELQEERLHRYAGELKQLMKWATANDIRVVFCVPAAAEAGMEPNRSTCVGASSQDERVLEELWTNVRTLQRNGRSQEALKECQRALQMCPDNAEFHFRAGECLRELGQHDAALKHFQRALDTDQLPLRATASYRRAGRQVARAHGVAVIETMDILRPLSSDGIVDNVLFPDGVHPNIDCCCAIGLAIADAVHSGNLLNAKLSSPDTLDFDAERCIRELELNKADVVQGLRATASVLRHYTRFRPFDGETRLREAARFDQRADDLSDGSLSLPDLGLPELPEQ